MNKSQKGFGHLVIIIAVLVVGAISASGYLVYKNNNKKTASSVASTSTATKASTESTSVATISYKLPSNWTWYENKDFGFKFAYPKAYGSFASLATAPGYPSGHPISDDHLSAYYVSDTPSTEFSPGISGKLQLSQFVEGYTTIFSGKYGPYITNRDNKWIVTELNPSDTHNTLGGVYKNREGKEVVPYAENGIDVYTFSSADEGSVNYKIDFVLDGRLYQIDIPVFEDGTYGPQGQTQPRDQSTYDNLLNEIVHSVSRL